MWNRCGVDWSAECEIAFPISKLKGEIGESKLKGEIGESKLKGEIGEGYNIIRGGQGE